jgi:5,10-methylenetetrahydromethanopterin reductase
MAVSRELADGVILIAPPGANGERWPHCALLANGSVLDPGEDHTSRRLIEAAGPAYAAGLHALWEWARDIVPTMPGGPGWLESIEAEQPDGRRHLAVHEGHLVAVTDHDRPAVEAAGEAILSTGWTGDAASSADPISSSVFTLSRCFVLSFFSATVRCTSRSLRGCGF